MTKPKHRRGKSHFRFSIRLLLVLLCLVCSGLSLYAHNASRFGKETKAVEFLEDKCGGVFFTENLELEIESDEVAGPVWDWGQLIHFRLYQPVIHADLFFEDHVSEEHLDHIYSLSNLSTLNLTFPASEECSLINFSRLKKLKELTIDDTQLRMEELRSISQLGELETLSLRNCELGDERVLCLAKLDLISIDLRDNSNLSDNSIEKLILEMPRLKSVNVSGTAFRGEFFNDQFLQETIANFSMKSTPIDSAAFSNICRNLPSLIYINATRTKIDDAVIPNILKHPTLTTLRIPQTDISKTGLQQIEDKSSIVFR